MNELTTSELYFAAYLKTIGVPLVRTHKAGRQTFFTFDTTGEDESELKSGWHLGTASVLAKPFATEIQNLKAMVMA